MSNEENPAYLKSLQEKAQICFREERFAEALINLQKILETTAEPQGETDPLFRARILSNMGIVQVKKECFSEAIDNFQAALEIFNAQNDTFSEAQQWGNIGSSYRDLQKYDKAISNYEKALSLYEKTGQTAAAADQFTNLAYAYAMNREKDRAVDMYRKAAALYNELQDKNRYSLTMKNLEALEKMP